MRRSPLLCRPEEKAELEARNTLNQLEFLTDLVHRGATEVRESHVRELQRIAVQDVYPCGGQYRDARFQLKISDSTLRPPEPAMLRGLMAEFLDNCNDRSAPANVRMAYALWRFNWIHPFPGGNGRTARALSYLIFCMDMKQMPPGDITIPALIASDRNGYIAALRAVDERYESTGDSEVRLVHRVDVLAPMVRYLDEKIEAQLLSGLEQGIAQLPPGWRPFASFALALLKSYLRNRQP